MITICIRVNMHIEALNKVVNEVSKYPIWKALYFEDTINVEDLKKSINYLYEQREGNSELEMHFSFTAGQMLKKIILYYLQKNYKEMDLKQFKDLTDFIILMDERLESDIIFNFTEFYPQVKAWNKGV